MLATVLHMGVSLKYAFSAHFTSREQKKKQENRRRKIKSKTQAEWQAEGIYVSSAAFTTNSENYFDDSNPPERNVVSAPFFHLVYEECSKNGRIDRLLS